MKGSKINIPVGFLFSGINCGIKKRKRDLGLIYSATKTLALAKFTKNNIKSNSIKVCLENMKKTSSQRAILVNSGNANCANGKRYFSETQNLVKEISKKLSLKKEEVFIASTGKISIPFPSDKIKKAFDRLLKNLSPYKVLEFAESIMTTDTFPKIVSSSLKIKDRNINILGIVKGAGMIHPDFATMLCFLLTDAKIDRNNLDKIVNDCLQDSFHRINVDSALSTNDSVFLLCNGLSEIDLTKNKKYLKAFKKELSIVFKELSKKIIEDAEGANKFITVRIKGLEFNKAKKVFDAICQNILLRISFCTGFNLGRLIQSLGAVPSLKIRETDFSISLSSENKKYQIFKKGEPNYKNLNKVTRLVNNKRFTIEIDFFKKPFSFEFYTSDLSSEYVKINLR